MMCPITVTLASSWQMQITFQDMCHNSTVVENLARFSEQGHRYY